MPGEHIRASGLLCLIHQDVDECAPDEDYPDKIGPCGNNADCINTYISFFCLCKDGYRTAGGNLNFSATSETGCDGELSSPGSVTFLEASPPRGDNSACSQSRQASGPSDWLSSCWTPPLLSVTTQLVERSSAGLMAIGHALLASLGSWSMPGFIERLFGGFLELILVQSSSEVCSASLSCASAVGSPPPSQHRAEEEPEKSTLASLVSG